MSKRRSIGDEVWVRRPMWSNALLCVIPDTPANVEEHFPCVLQTTGYCNDVECEEWNDVWVRFVAGDEPSAALFHVPECQMFDTKGEAESAW